MTAETPASPPLDAYPDFLSALLAGNRHHCAALAQHSLTAGVPVSDLYQQWFQRALYRIGELWECNQVSVATEHLATSIIESLLNQVYPQIIAPRRVGKSIVISSVEGELHQVGGKMVCDIFEMHGWDTYYLGADTPTRDLLRLLREQRPNLVGLSLSLYFHIGVLQNTVGAIRTEFPDLPILIGGQGMRHIGSTLIPDRAVYYLAGLNEINRFLAAQG